MKKFKFRLQSVLDTREKALEDRQLEFAIIKNKLYQLNKTLESFYQKLENTKNSLEKVIDNGKTIDILSISNHQNYIEKLKEDILNQNKLIADAEMELEEKKKELAEALKAKTILEKLKEKDYMAFQKELERLDFIQIDEIATSRYKK